MIIPVAALLVLLIPVLLGGRLARMAQVQLRRGSWIMGALGVQVLIIELLTGPQLLLQAAHIATYVVAAWCLIVNRRIPGLWLIGLGAASNGITIAVNAGTLPARAGALQAAGLYVPQSGFVNSGLLLHPHLAWLGDMFAVPAPLPLANVSSIGDILIITGLAVASWRICGTRWTTPWVPPAPRRRHLADRRTPTAPATPTRGGTPAAAST
jgi:hypothetical protein